MTRSVFIWLMMAALLAGAIWLNMATAIGAPVSTTHSIVGGVLGAGIAAGGWIISPLLGGIIAAFFLYWIKHSITYKKDMIGAAKSMVPVLISLMHFVLQHLSGTQGFEKIWKIDLVSALTMSVAMSSLGGYRAGFCDHGSFTVLHYTGNDVTLSFFQSG